MHIKFNIIWMREHGEQSITNIITQIIQIRLNSEWKINVSGHEKIVKI